MLVNRQTINCAFAFSCKKFALFELTDPMRRKIFVQMFLQGEARLIALQVPKERLSGNLTSIGRICSNPLCLAGQYFLTGLWLNEISFCRSPIFIEISESLRSEISFLLSVQNLIHCRSDCSAENCANNSFNRAVQPDKGNCEA